MARRAEELPDPAARQMYGMIAHQGALAASLSTQVELTGALIDLIVARLDLVEAHVGLRPYPPISGAGG